MTYPTACSRSWTEVNIDFKRGILGHCCRAVYYDLPDDYTVDFFANSEHIQKRRQDTLAGIQHPDCQSCWDSLKDGVTPFREWVNEWDNFDNETPDTPRISGIEIELENTCDLSCLYCGADASSKIAQEEGITVHNKTREKDIIIFKEWLSDTVNNSDSDLNISFLGGEPTASKLFYELIDYIVSLDNKNITLQITTNCNSKDYLFNKFLDTITKSQCKWHIHISNESFKEDSELIRYGLDWDRFEQNLRAYAANEKVNHINFDVSMTSIALPTFPEYVEWIYSIMSEYDKKFSILGDVVRTPSELDVAILPESFKTYMDQAIEIVKERQLPNRVREDKILIFLEAVKNRIGSNYQEDYQNIVKKFLESKQKYKKTDKLMRLVNPLG